MLRSLILAAAGVVLFGYAAVAAPRAPYNWTGFYVGGSAGARWTQPNLSVVTEQQIFSPTFVQDNFPICLSDSSPCSGGDRFNSAAFRFGPYVGFNWQLTPMWVVGLEGDFAWANNNATRNGFKFSQGGTPGDSFTIKTTWDASVRARAGYLVTPNTLLFLTSGVAFIQLEHGSACVFPSCDVPDEPAVVSSSTVRTGWTLGGGIETVVGMLGPNWLARAEYRYANFGKARYTDVRPCTVPGLANCNTEIFTNVTYDVSLISNSVMLGLAYKFH
jgi:outer membrane immunogenic protein